VPSFEPRLGGAPRAHSENPDFEDLFEHAPCAYLVLGPDGRICRANATFSKWTSIEAKALVGKQLGDLLSASSCTLYQTKIEPLLHLRDAIEDISLDVIDLSGANLPVLINASEQRDSLGHVLSTRVTMVRGERRRGYERALKTREAVALERLLAEQSASEMREQFIAVLGHDLRNPLAAVSSGVRLLQRDPSKERADQIAVMMHASVLRMSGLIENVLDFARGRLGGGISLRQAPADLETAIMQVVDEVRSAYPDFEIEDHYDLPLLVDCDAARMSQLVSNLVANACSHGDHATPVTLRASVGSDGLEISVSNSGAPITEEQLKTLFEPFSRIAGSAPVQGLGLGLFIASEIAKSHGATLSAASSVSETRFTLQMPLASK